MKPDDQLPIPDSPCYLAPATRRPLPDHRLCLSYLFPLLANGSGSAVCRERGAKHRTLIRFSFHYLPTWRQYIDPRLTLFGTFQPPLRNNQFYLPCRHYALRLAQPSTDWCTLLSSAPATVYPFLPLLSLLLAVDSRRIWSRLEPSVLGCSVSGPSIVYL